MCFFKQLDLLLQIHFSILAYPDPYAEPDLPKKSQWIQVHFKTLGSNAKAD